MFFNRYTFILCLCLLSTNSSVGQWLHINGPTGGTISSFSSSGNTLFCSVINSKLFRSLDNGLTWERLPLPDGITRVDGIAVDGDMVFLASTPGKVYRSFNKGTTWELANTGITDPGQISTINMLEGNLFLSTSGTVYKSIDYGSNWVPAGNGLTVLPIKTFKLIEGTIFAITVYNSFFRSTNSGTNWSPIPISHAIYSIDVRDCIFFSNIIYVAASTGIYRSTNFGQYWLRLNSGLNNTSVSSIHYEDSIILAGTAAGIYRTTNLGLNWTLDTTQSSSTENIVFISHGTNRIFAGEFSGKLFYSDDLGLQWNRLNNGISESTHIRFLNTNKQKIFALAGYQGLFKSSDEGINWERMNHSLSNNLINDILLQDSMVFIATRESGILVSKDFGETWRQINHGLGSVSTGPLYSNNAYMFAGVTLSSGSFLFRTLAGDTSWSPVPYGNTGNGMRGITGNGTTVFVGTDNAIFKSENNGETWAISNFGNNHPPITVLRMFGEKLFAGTFGDGILVSTDLGESWNSSNFGLTNLRINDIRMTDSVLLAGTNNGLFLSTNFGTQWDSIPLFLSESNRVLAAIYHNQKIFIGTQNDGVLWKWYSGITSTSEPRLQSDLDVLLYQNFPNPFNASTTIKYRLNKPESISINVFDILGTLVDVVLLGQQPIGDHKVRFDAGKLPSGVYFYKIQYSNGHQMGKFIILK